MKCQQLVKKRKKDELWGFPVHTSNHTHTLGPYVFPQEEVLFRGIVKYQCENLCWHAIVLQLHNFIRISLGDCNTARSFRPKTPHSEGTVSFLRHSCQHLLKSLPPESDCLLLSIVLFKIFTPLSTGAPSWYSPLV